MGPNDRFGLPFFNTGNTVCTDKDECRYIFIFQAMCIKSNHHENIMIHLYLEKKSYNEIVGNIFIQY